MHGNLISLTETRDKYRGYLNELLQGWHIVSNDIVEKYQDVFDSLEEAYTKLFFALYGTDIDKMSDCYKQFKESFKKAQEVCVG